MAIKNVTLVGLVLFALTAPAQAQTDSSNIDLFKMSFEDLMNVRIVSASKHDEDLFSAPLSASVLTREEIQKAGCTSIMEAFRLMPGLIVREQTNGNFDIHLRGMNGVSLTGVLASASNVTTLVMIDNRPVYSYLHGGTFWEAIPVDINDVDRIEVVRGPASALYGPNAVSGVINIITNKLRKTGWHTVANAQYGTYNTAIANASVGYKFSKKSDFVVSGNFQNRDRSQSSYYETFRNHWIENPDSLLATSGFPETFTKEKFADRSLAMDKYGLNAFVNYAPFKKVNIHIAAGLQDSKVQNIYFEGHSTPLNTTASNSKYFDVKASVGNFSAEFTHSGGTYTSQVGGPGQRYDFHNIDAVAEYNFTFRKLSIRPGINYRKSTTDDSKYVTDLLGSGFFTGNGFDGQNVVLTNAAFLRADYRMLSDKLRLVAGIRIDEFNYPDEFYASYQFAATYSISQSNMLRFVYGRANQSPLVSNTYINYMPYRMPATIDNQVIPGHFIEVYVQGNTGLELVTSDMLELGYRSNLSKRLQLDVEVFVAENKKYAESVMSREYVEIKGPQDTVSVWPFRIINIPLKARQFGATVSLSYNTKKIQFRPFLTVQATRLYNFSHFLNTGDIAGFPGQPDPAFFNIYSGVGTSQKHTGTPDLYGGFVMNYQLTRKINVNVNAYYYSSHTFHTRVYTEFNDGVRGVDKISAKLLLNSSITYNPVPSVSVFATVKNILGENQREFYRSDALGRMLTIGASFKLN